MKQLFTLFAAGSFLFAHNAHAQSWCPPGAKWSYYNSGSPGTGTVLTFVGDTVIDGFAGQRITQLNTFIIPWNPDSIIIFGGPDIVTRTEPGMVLWWLSQTQEWDTLYWFGAQLGDGWSPGWEQQFPSDDSCSTNAYLQVVDTGAIVVDGVSLRTLVLERHLNGSDVDLSFTIMERVGNTWEYFFPDPPYICLINEGLMNFGCYADDEIRYPPSTFPCGSIMAVKEEDHGDGLSWSVSPVPFGDRFTIRSVIPRNATMFLLDMTGRELLAIPFRGMVLEIDPGQLPAGSYVLRMVDERGTLGHRLVIKE